jgi:ADP-heptose:LPS heptosyltransferase
MNFVKKILLEEAMDSISQPISESVNSNKRTYLLEKGFSKLGWRAFRRLIAFRLSGQKKYLKNTAKQEYWKKCLWIYYDIPQIGDALMDLAPRSLLKTLNITVDLYTHTHIAALFKGDLWLNSVETDPKNIRAKDYDFVIVSSYKWRSLKHKFIYANQLPWISVFGKFSGPELNRALYSTKRIAELFQKKLSSSELEFHACQKLDFQTDIGIQRISMSVLLTVGGVDQTRTYKDWYSTVLGLKNLGVNNIILVGSENGIAYTDKIKELNQEDFTIQDYVGKTSLQECRKLMQTASIIIATDGGLMHLAVTSGTPTIGLFNQAINPAWRLPSKLLGLSIQSKTRDINDISSQSIIDVIGKLIP